MSEGWKDGQNLFHRTLLATTRGPIVKPNEGFVLYICKIGESF